MSNNGKQYHWDRAKNIYKYFVIYVRHSSIFLQSKVTLTFFLAQLSCKKFFSRFLHQNLNKATGVDQTKRRIKRPTLTFSVTLTLPFLFILFFKNWMCKLVTLILKFKDSVFTVTMFFFKIDIWLYKFLLSITSNFFIIQTLTKHQTGLDIWDYIKHFKFF